MRPYSSASSREGRDNAKGLSVLRSGSTGAIRENRYSDSPSSQEHSGKALWLKHTTTRTKRQGGRSMALAPKVEQYCFQHSFRTKSISIDGATRACVHCIWYEQYRFLPAARKAARSLAPALQGLRDKGE